MALQLDVDVDGSASRPYHSDEPPRFVGCFDNEKIAFVEYHYILPVFNLNDFNWTQTPSAVDDKTVETVRGVIPADKIVVFRFGVIKQVRPLLSPPPPELSLMLAVNFGATIMRSQTPTPTLPTTT